MGLFGFLDSHEQNATTTSYSDSFNSFRSDSTGYNNLGNFTLNLGGAAGGGGASGILGGAAKAAGNFASSLPPWLGPVALVGALGVLAFMELRKR